MPKHNKHTKLIRPTLGEFARQEWAIIGTPCGNIQQITNKVLQALKPSFQLAYVDADHPPQNPSTPPSSVKTLRATSLFNRSLTYTDKITHHQLSFVGDFNTFQRRPIFNQVDGVLVNGNHFKAKQQVVVIDARKFESLGRKLDRLTDVILFLIEEEGSTIPPFLQDHLPHWESIPQLSTKDHTAIQAFFQQQLETQIPPLSGLILAGGKSQRMGQDKGLLNYHGKPQREFMLDLLQEHCENTYLSCRADQVETITHPHIVDTFIGLGPFGAILSAFRSQPNHAWLVLACDLPLLDQKTIDLLIQQRNPSKVATAFYNPATQFPEPLITIWEPRSYLTLFEYLAQGYSCPRKALINSDIELIKLENPAVLKNVNTPEERADIIASNNQFKT